MTDIVYREATEEDIPKIAKLRVIYSGTVEYWADRILNYFRGQLNPQKALPQRVIYVAAHNSDIVAFIAGHLSTRYNCEGELQWLDTLENYRRKGIATSLLKILGKWFIENNAYKICVDPGNPNARTFYQDNRATNLNDHWMFWIDIRIVQTDRL
jgi:GNAT superfamily N-acetyltransferase